MNGRPTNAGYSMVQDFVNVTNRLKNQMGINSFVIGFGTLVDPDQLNAIARTAARAYPRTWTCKTRSS